MELPKTVLISGKTYAVHENPETWNSKATNGVQKITVGTQKNQSPQRIFGNYLHEVVEAITAENRFRYEADNGEFVFVMTHKEFDKLCSDTEAAIWPMIKRAFDDLQSTNKR